MDALVADRRNVSSTRFKKAVGGKSIVGISGQPRSSIRPPKSNAAMVSLIRPFTEWDQLHRRDNRVGAHLHEGSSSQPPRLAALPFDHDRQIPTAKGSRGRGPLHIELSHRRPQSREGSRERHPSKGRLWHRRHSPHYDPGQSPSLLQ